MNDTAMVTVYNFELTDGGIEAARLANFKATREEIRAIRSARLLEGTGEKIPLSGLDAQGHYRRVATAWGEL